MKRIRLSAVFALTALFLSQGSLHAQSAGTNDLTPKQRMQKGEKLNMVRVSTDADRTKVHEIIDTENPDLLYLDGHHVACTEWDISRICEAAAEKKIGVLMRIDHANQAGMISSMLDLGLAGIKVPTVEDEETIQEIIDGFYYPPLGKRSLGGAFNWGEKIAMVPDGDEYYRWWNNNGILGIKLETVRGVLLSRFLAQPGIDFMDFGGQDLGHDLMIQQHPLFKTIDDCRDFVEKSLVGTGMYF